MFNSNSCAALRCNAQSVEVDIDKANNGSSHVQRRPFSNR